MKTKNISIERSTNKIIPSKETYLVFNSSKNNIKIVQKFIDQKKNVSISLNSEECLRLMNLLNFYIFDIKYEYNIDEMLIFEKENGIINENQ